MKNDFKFPGPYSTVAEIKAANKAAGSFFFSPDTMRFFGSKIVDDVIGGRLFITSEQPPNEPRLYTLRVAQDDGRILTGEAFGKFNTAAQARWFAQSLLKAANSSDA